MLNSKTHNIIKFVSFTSESVHRMFWECTAWQNIREKHALASQAWRPDWPACFACCGLLTDGVCIDVPPPMPACDPEPESEPLLLVLDEQFIRGCVVVYTDGACTNNQYSSLRKAGLGAWWADGHARNLSESLPGAAQTNQRAELLAVIRVLEVESRPVHIKTDSQYVCRGCGSCEAWAADRWRKVHNSDLWQRLHKLLQTRRSHFHISKVKGHASRSDVLKGRVKAEDKHGNDSADTLARAGAALHALPPAVVHAAKHRHAVAESVQRMMVEIVLARASCKSESNSSTGTSHADSAASSSCCEGLFSDSDAESIVDDMQAQVPLHSGSNHPT